MELRACATWLTARSVTRGVITGLILHVTLPPEVKTQRQQVSIILRQFTGGKFKEKGEKTIGSELKGYRVQQVHPRVPHGPVILLRV